MPVAGILEHKTMIILISSKIRQSDILDSLGKPEYSYFFLMKDFMPALERVGRVLEVQSVDEVDRLYANHSAQGEDVVFLSFSPPQQAPLGLNCPTICVFAWEFDTLPFFAWGGNPQNDWRYVFDRLHGAISTSHETAKLVRKIAPIDFPATALPAPVWDRYADLGSPDGAIAWLGARGFGFSGIAIDSPSLGLSADGLVRSSQVADPVDPIVEKPDVLRELWTHTQSLVQGWWREINLPLEPAELVSASDTSMFEELECDPVMLAVQGVVYTTVLNPADGRKNWIDLITAFCWAFKNTEDVTLIVKMTHHDIEFYRVTLMTLLSRLAPFKCRVLVLHGFLEDDQYRQLISASNFYVSAAFCEGLCLPLMEFLSSGKPAIAPDHTAMADYIDDQVAFVLKYSLELTCWPQDPAGMQYAHRHRISWQSLVDAFRASYESAQGGSLIYQNMSREAFLRMRGFASVSRVSELLGEFLAKNAVAARG